MNHLAMFSMVLGALKVHFHCSLSPTASHTKPHPGVWHMHYKNHVKGGTGTPTENGDITTPLGVDEMAEWCNRFVLVPKANGKVRLSGPSATLSGIN